jgi:tritrans,polycis-undecaprenyl-diphosphate synthase [geranylgeranyl-diphosphate specific]
MELFKKEFERLYHDKRIMEDSVKINILGRIHLLPKDLQELFHKIMKKTEKNNSYVVNFAIAYGGREEVVDAVMRLSKDVKNGILEPKDVNESIFQNYLYTPSEPDLIIRTGGDNRTSNFLIWQSNYSEWFFLEKCWPEIEKEDFIKVIEEFQQRERRFGK